jgi:hypothetical protein
LFVNDDTLSESVSDKERGSDARYSCDVRRTALVN